MGAQTDFIRRFQPMAVGMEKVYQIPPLVAVTQSAHESNWGQSGLTQKANNLFGITGDSWQKEGKPVILLPTWEFVNLKWVEVERPFRRYESWEDSLKDWAVLISTNKIYAKAYALGVKKDVDGCLKEIAKAGYATDPKYLEKLLACERDVSLRQKLV